MQRLDHIWTTGSRLEIITVLECKVSQTQNFVFWYICSCIVSCIPYVNKSLQTQIGLG